MSIWILAADSARARLFQRSYPEETFAEVLSFSNGEARLKDNELISDKPGVHGDGAALGRHAMGQKKSAKRVASDRFAREIATVLEQGCDSHDFQKLYIVSAPGFLGELRAQLPDKVKNLVAAEVTRNVTTFESDEIRELLPRSL